MASFGSQFQDIGGGDWVSSDEKAALVESGQPFTINEVLDDDGNKYGARFVLKITLTNPESGEDEERNLGFTKVSVESRDRMLIAMQKGTGDYPGLQNGGDPVLVKLDKVGNSYLIRVVEDE